MLNSIIILCFQIEYFVYEEIGNFLYFNSDGFSFHFAEICLFVLFVLVGFVLFWFCFACLFGFVLFLFFS